MQNNKNNRNNKRVKGFTLTEMIVVIAIIGILAAILAPTMSSYYTMSRIKDANADARMVFNAAQTEMHKYANLDRMSGTPGVFSGAVIVQYRENGVITTTENADLNSVPADITSSPNKEIYEELAAKVNRTVSDGEEINWAICIENYVVKGCFSAESPGTNYIGRASANNGSTKAEATEKASTSFQTAMLTGSALTTFTEQFYNLDAVS